MKVIKNNFKSMPVVATCAYCESEIKLESKEDVIPQGCRPNKEGKMSYCWYCPCCGNCNEIEI